MTPPRALSILLACEISVTLAACGSSGSPAAGASSSSTATAPVSSSAPAAAGGSGASKTIAANWTAFFSAKTPVARRISLLQDGQQFASVIKGQAGSGLASQASAKVASVSLSSPTQAAVTYSILVAGQSALAAQKGVAVQQGGTWKVGLASFCGLLSLENTGSSAKLPPACGSAGK